MNDHRYKKHGRFYFDGVRYERNKFQTDNKFAFLFFSEFVCHWLGTKRTSSVSTNAVPPILEGTDLYGSNRLTLVMVKESHGELLQKSIDEFLAGNTEAYQRNKKIFSDSLTKD